MVSGGIDFIQMTVPGDGYFDAVASIQGGGGSVLNCACYRTNYWSSD